MEKLTKVLSVFLRPFSWVYGGVMAVRNVLFSNGILSSTAFDLPIISIGNITVGGTGKTPHTEFVLDLLSDRFNIAVLSRGYGRQTNGFREVAVDSAPVECGDEPCQMKRKFPQHTVAVDEDRRHGVEQLLKKQPLDLVVLDDAYQHRWVQPGLSLLLVDYTRPIFNDHVLPAGRLREFPRGSRRADVIIVTKCPLLISAEEKNKFKEKLHLHGRQQLFFSMFRYGVLKPVFDDVIKFPLTLGNTHVLLLTGIANPQPLADYLSDEGALVDLISYPDHYAFANDDARIISKRFASLPIGQRMIITTEKDAVRLQSGLILSEEVKNNLFYLPIKVEILERKEVLQQIIEDYVTKN